MKQAEGPLLTFTLTSLSVSLFLSALLIMFLTLGEKNLHQILRLFRGWPPVWRPTFSFQFLDTFYYFGVEQSSACNLPHFSKAAGKIVERKKCKLAPLKKIGAKNSMTLSAGELTPFGIRNVMCSILCADVSPFFHVSWQVLLISLS